jgi:uncharacterized OsmC-like protein/alpha/beta superfamily hydrolase
MQFQRLTFENNEGQSLAARLDLPIDEKPTAYALFAHCFTCTKNFKALVHINRALARHGIAVLRFDFTGLGESEGDFSETSLSSNVADLVAAAEFLKSNFEAPQLLIGHSLGGAAVLQAAEQIASTKAVVTISAPSGLDDLVRYLRDRKETGPEGETEITLGTGTFRLKNQFIDDLEQVRMQEVIKRLAKPLLILHSPQDEVVSLKNAMEIFENADHPKSFIALDKADHLLSNRNDSRYAGSVLAAWAGKYLALPEKRVRKEDLRDNRVLARTGKKGFQTELKVNRHRFIADEPVPEGGGDTGPTPYDYLVGALGACTAMTIRMYADRKKWPVEEILVRLRHEKIHADDCRDCEKKEGKVDHIEREIEVAGPLDKEQKERLLAIANKCPVHRTLTSEIAITSRLKE